MIERSAEQKLCNQITSLFHVALRISFPFICSESSFGVKLEIYVSFGFSLNHNFFYVLRENFRSSTEDVNKKKTTI